MAIELTEKIGIVDKEIFCRMLGLTELPLFLLEEYFRIKRLIDKVDGRFSPCDLAGMALRCGFDPDTMKFVPLATPSPDEPWVGILPSEPIKYDNTPVKEADKSVARPPESQVIEVGTHVEILVDDAVVEGEIAGTQETDGERTYDVKTENGELHTVSENEIDIVQG